MKAAPPDDDVFVGIGIPDSDIYLIEGLFSKAETKEILQNFLENPSSYAISASESHGFDTVRITSENMDSAKKIISKLEQALSKIFEYDFKSIVLPDVRTSIKVQKTGQSHPVHSDCHEDTESGEESGTEVVYSAIFCLSDDYLGGEVAFPNEDVLIKLEAGSALIFPSSNHWHEVKVVTLGTRYSFLTFWE